jgi:MFS family permease
VRASSALSRAGLTGSFDTSIWTIQWVSTGYLLSIALVIPLTGRLAERFGTRPMWRFALAVFTVGSVLCGVAWSAGVLVAARVLQGVGGGMIVPLGLMILARAAGPDRRGRVMALAAVPRRWLRSSVHRSAGWLWTTSALTGGP